MKKLMILAVGVLFLTGAKAQEVNVGVDMYNRYVWRGTQFGNGPSIQPSVEFSKGVFSIGAWGAFSSGVDAFAEADLYAKLAFENGLSFGVSDYYYPGSSWFEFDDKISSHAFELNLGYEIGKLTLAGNYIFNDASAVGAAGSIGGDMYFEAGYDAGLFSAFVGGGNGWHTLKKDTDFQVVNVGISAEKEIKITDTFSIPLSGAVIVNPNSEQMNIVVGVSF